MIVHLPGPLHPIELPDVGEGICCEGALYRGADGCTCWEPVYDRYQIPLADCDRDAPDETRERMCADCAFRADSPERTGEGRYENSEPGDIERLVAGDTPFRCHDGARRIVALVHTPTGHRIDLAGLDHYDPPKDSRRAYMANGEPLLICAGWAAAHARAERSVPADDRDGPGVGEVQGEEPEGQGDHVDRAESDPEGTEEEDHGGDEGEDGHGASLPAQVGFSTAGEGAR